MPLCEFDPLGDDRYQCRYCGGPVRASVLPIRRRCRRDDPPRVELDDEPANTRDLPPLVERLPRFLAAAARHVRAGRPMRTEEQVLAILEQHCRPCAHYTGTHCAACGCRTTSGRFLNKLAWATEHCPLSPPRW